jgi:hypothetical protein
MQPDVIRSHHSSLRRQMSSDNNRSPVRVRVRLKTRASRTRERTDEIVEVSTPQTREGQINGLTALVEKRFPGATLRVFHEGAGSFTRDDLHIVAAYQGLDEVGARVRTREDGETADDDGFQQLPLTA